MKCMLFSFFASVLSVAAFAVELDLAGEWSLIAVKDIQTGTYAKTDKPDVSPYIPARSLSSPRTRSLLNSSRSRSALRILQNYANDVSRLNGNHL